MWSHTHSFFSIINTSYRLLSVVSFYTSTVHVLPNVLLIGDVILKLQTLLKIHSIKCAIDINSIKCVIELHNIKCVIEIHSIKCVLETHSIKCVIET
jgi:hypothetical protein